MPTRRQYLRGTAATGSIAMVGGTAGCTLFDGGSSESDSADITVGVLTMLNLDVGKATRRGVELAAKQIEEEGVLDGDVSVEAVGTEGASSAAVEGHNSLVEREGADVTLGTFAEQTAAGIMENIAQTETIHLNVGAISPELPAKLQEDYESFKPWFRLAPMNANFFVADMLGFAEEYLVGKQGWTKTAIFREDALWTEQIAPALEEGFAGFGMEVKDDVVFSLSETNYRSYMDQFADMDLDCVYGLIAEAGKGPLLGYEKSSLETPLVGSLVASQSPQYLSDIDSDTSNSIGQTFTTWGATLSQTAQEFVDLYTETYDSRPSKPTWAAFGGYAATRLYASARAEAGDDLDATIDALETGSFDLNQTYEVYEPGEAGPDGNEYPHDLKYGPGLYQPTWSTWNEGEQVTVYPDTFANEEF